LHEISLIKDLLQPGRYLDIGANVGSMTTPFIATPDIRIDAFEPFPVTFQMLARSVAGHGGGSIPPNVRLHNAAVSDYTGTARLSIPLVQGGMVHQWASIEKDFENLRGAPGITGVEHVSAQVVTIDSFGFDDVRVMKVDVEGAELEVFRGAIRTVQRCRPFIIAELEERHRPGCTYSVPAYLDALGYDCFFQLGDGFVPIRTFDRLTMQRASESPESQPESYSDPYIAQFAFVPREDDGMRRTLFAHGTRMAKLARAVALFQPRLPAG
jgi:FkbM family methyltransferase